MEIKRRTLIRDYIDKVGEVKIKSLEEMFPDVSNMTLRRDLTYLESKGYIIRTHGGARSVHLIPTVSEDIYSLRAAVNLEGKEEIARKAVKFVEPGRSIFIDSGTTMMRLAKLIPDENLSILTSGPNIGLEIIKKSHPSVTLIGGNLSRNTLSTSGVSSLDFVKQINIDTAFLATSGFSLETGFTSGNFNECQLKQAIMRKARKTILLMDSTKIDKSLTFTFATLNDINILICDKNLPEDIMKAAARSKVTIY